MTIGRSALCPLVLEMRADVLVSTSGVATLADVPHTWLRSVVEKGVEVLILSGTWAPSAAGLAWSRLKLGIDSAAVAQCSPFAIPTYVVAPTLGGDAALAAFRTRANSLGLRVMLDFVGACTSVDCAWTALAPWLYVQPSREEEASPESFFSVEVPEGLQSMPGKLLSLAYGTDGRYAWPDTAMLDWRSPAVLSIMGDIVASIARRGLADGLRVHAAALCLKNVLKALHDKRPSPLGPGPAAVAVHHDAPPVPGLPLPSPVALPSSGEMEGEPWAGVCAAGRAVNPAFLFIADDPSDGAEADLLGAGFDAVYDGTLLDLVLGRESAGSETQYQLRWGLAVVQALGLGTASTPTKRSAASVLAASRPPPLGALLLKHPDGPARLEAVPARPHFACRAEAVRNYLAFPAAIQRRCVRFTECGGGTRILAATSEGGDRSAYAITALVMCLPGVRLLTAGQVQGARVTHPVHVAVAGKPTEPPTLEAVTFHRRLFYLLAQPTLRSGLYHLGRVTPSKDGNPSHANMVVLWWTPPVDGLPLPAFATGGGSASPGGGSPPGSSAGVSTTSTDISKLSSTTGSNGDGLSLAFSPTTIGKSTTGGSAVPDFRTLPLAGGGAEVSPPPLRPPCSTIFAVTINLSGQRSNGHILMVPGPGAPDHACPEGSASAAQVARLVGRHPPCELLAGCDACPPRVVFTDWLDGGGSFEYGAALAAKEGVWLDLPPWAACAWEVSRL